MATDPQLKTSGETEPVWVHALPWRMIPEFPSLEKDIQTDVCIIGAGIAGISAAYELVNRGKKVVLIDARHMLSGESGRTSGHLSNALDDGYTQIAKKHGISGAKEAAESHTWALNRVGEIAKKLEIECEFRHLPAYEISQYMIGHKAHDEELETLKKEVSTARELGLSVKFDKTLTVGGWDGEPDQRGGAVFAKQATFHPTKYLSGVLAWLKKQDNFEGYADTRVLSVEEGSSLLGRGGVAVKTEPGHTITAQHAIQATCVPLQKLSVIAQMEYNRTYCIAIRIPRGYVEDCLIYDQAEPYRYVRLTACDNDEDYLVIGGCDHKVGQEQPEGRFEELETWVRERFTKAGSVDYRWSGQIYEPIDYMAYIGKNQGSNYTYIVTGDSGNGLTHGVLAAKLIADDIDEVPTSWAKLYNPSRLKSVAKSLPSMLSHDIEINTQYKRFAHTDISDIEDLAPGKGGVLNKGLPQNATAVYKEENGKVHEYSAVCPHMKGMVCWNDIEKSWDCPVHGSRFSKNGLCVDGPAKANLTPIKKPPVEQRAA